MEEKIFITLSESDAERLLFVIKDVVESGDYSLDSIRPLIHLEDEIYSDLNRLNTKKGEAANV